MKRAWMLFLVAGLGGACSDDETSTPDDPGQTRSGITSCGPIECQAGQYCLDAITCEPGCTSDNNCTATETCDRPSGMAVGSCKAGPVAKDCDAFIGLCTMCGQPQDTCSNACLQATAECVACTVESNSCNAGGSCSSQCGLE